MARRWADDLERFVTRIRHSLVPSEYQAHTVFSRVDYLLAVNLGLLATIIATWGCAQFDPRVYDHWNIYFQADPNRVLEDMTERYRSGFHRQGGVHPIFSMLTYPVMRTLLALGMTKISAGNLLMILCAGGSGSCFYLALRALDLPCRAAAAFAVTFLASATFVHWFSIIDTFALAAFTIVLSLLAATRCRVDQFGPWFAVSVLSLSVTVTNWAIGLAVGFFRLAFRPFIKVTAAAFLAVALISCLQKLVFPSATLFFNPFVLKHEVSFLQTRLEKAGVMHWTPALNFRAMLITSAVAPAPTVEDISTTWGGVFRLVNNQYAALPALVSTAMPAIVCWSFMLAMGLWGAWRDTARRAVSMAVIAYVGFQLTLHSVYGDITFLYAGNFFPALVMLTAFGWYTPAQNWVLGAAMAFTVFAGINNYTQFLTAARLSNEIAANYHAAKP